MASLLPAARSARLADSATRLNFARPAFFLALSVAVAAITGCHATADARWTTRDDTVYRWQHAIPTLPVEVRGQLPYATNDDIVHAIPHAVERATADHLPARLVVEVGDTASPHDDLYCTKQGPTGTAAGHRDRLTLTVTLCDGDRLVARSQTLLNPDKGNVNDLPRHVSRLETLLLIGIERSPSQDTGIQG